MSNQERDQASDAIALSSFLELHLSRILFTHFLRDGHMLYVSLKYLITAAVVVLVSELAKRSDKLGSFIAALPLVTILSLIWLYIESQTTEKIANHAWYTFWYVIPTLPMFLFFPWVLPRLGFWISLVLSLVVCAVCFVVFAIVVRRWGVELW